MHLQRCTLPKRRVRVTAHRLRTTGTNGFVRRNEVGVIQNVRVKRRSYQNVALHLCSLDQTLLLHFSSRRRAELLLKGWICGLLDSFCQLPVPAASQPDPRIVRQLISGWAYNLTGTKDNNVGSPVCCLFVRAVLSLLAHNTVNHHIMKIKAQMRNKFE